MTKMKLSEEEIKILGNIADIGAKNASKYLSVMTKKKFSVSIPWVSLYPYEEIPQTVGKPSDMVTAVYMKVEGEVKGAIIVVFPEKEALFMSDLLLSKKGSTELDDMAKSALTEAAGNILANAYLNAISDKLDIKLTDSIPHLATDMLNAILGGVLAQFACKSENALIFKNNFEIQKKKINGHAFILFDPDSFDIIKKKIKNVRKD